MQDINQDILAERNLSPPEGYSTRGARLEDVEICFKLYNLWSRSVIGQDEIIDANAIRNEWCSPGFDPAEDIRLVFAPEGGLVGYIEVWTTSKPPVHPWIWGRVHPDYSDLGIGTWMLEWAETRASRALEELEPDLRFAPRTGVFHQADESRKLFEHQGYRNNRTSYDMLIEMDAPPEPVWPQGLTVRTYNHETDAENVYRTYVETFRDHFGFVESPFEEGFRSFEHLMVEADDFDPSLWYLAVESGLQENKQEIAGICLCRPRALESAEMGYIHVLGVRRPWRKRGLGLAFLQLAFGEFYRRGTNKVTLGVDAESLTGALRLYEKAGMHIYRQFDLFEKEIRPGRELQTEE